MHRLERRITETPFCYFQSLIKFRTSHLNIHGPLSLAFGKIVSNSFPIHFPRRNDPGLLAHLLSDLHRAVALAGLRELVLSVRQPVSVLPGTADCDIRLLRNHLEKRRLPEAAPGSDHQPEKRGVQPEQSEGRIWREAFSGD